MQLIAGALDFCARHATKLLAVGVLVGLAVPPLAEFMRPALVPAAIGGLIVAMLRLEFADVARFGRRPILSLTSVAVVLLASPVLIWLIAKPLGLPAGLFIGLVLMAAAPPIMSSPAFALILGLDAAFALYVTVAAHLLVPLTLPVMALWLMGLELDISLAAFMGRFAAIVAGSIAIAYGLKRWAFSPAFLTRHAKRFDGLAVIILVVFAIAIMDGVTATAFERPGFVALTVGAAFIANAGLQAVGAAVFWAAGRRIAFTAGHMIGNCNMGLVLAVLADKAAHDVVIFFALAQLPMYMLPGLAMPIYRKFLAR